MHHIVRIQQIHDVTHDVKQFRTDKPAGYTFVPGQATEVSINKPEWERENRPFTFTSLNEQPYLEFTIKRYSNHNGVTNQLHRLRPGDQLIIRDVWGAISYKGPGYFIAGGAGITPFIAILRQLYKDNELDGNKVFFSNKTAGDIIYEKELAAMLGRNLVNTLTEKRSDRYKFGRINEDFLAREVPDFHTHFYVCGPDKMIHDVNDILSRNGADAQSVVFEK